MPPGPPDGALKARCRVIIQQGDACSSEEHATLAGPARRPPTAVPERVPAGLCLLSF